MTGTSPSHRDSPYLWPLAAVISVAVHAVGLLSMRPLLLQSQAELDGAETLVPFQLITELPEAPMPPEAGIGAAAAPETTPTSADGTEASPAPESAPPQPPIPQALPFGQRRPMAGSIPGSTTAEPAEVTPAPEQPSDPAQPSPFPPPQADLAPPRPIPAQVSPPASPINASEPVSQPPGPAPPAPGTDSPPIPPNSSTNPPAAPASDQTGQLLARGIRADPQGRDFPDRPPQIRRDKIALTAPLAAFCAVTNLSALATTTQRATLQLRMRVDANGDISQTEVIQGSGNGAVDSLVQCLVEAQLQLEPAQTAGSPQLTDAFILEAELQF